ncbi:hypothetical protein K402DRAFT_181242 [Aulographum hederae CBS 113979]|uniref:Uncharacterized protein n=1 Tax=Aulographum hederae CBS 113979 TaxID=1176131 RepID=A0A6G1GQG9_9PEZI|nr:hypothetical protein K402DRAFT_181242 [Aulographum hederae CBS 113979]
MWIGGSTQGECSKRVSSCSSEAAVGGSGVVSATMLRGWGRSISLRGDFGYDGMQLENGEGEVKEVEMLMVTYLLLPQFYLSSTVYFAGVVEAVAGAGAAATFGYQFWGEGVVQLPSKHLLLVLGSRNEEHFLLVKVVHGCVLGVFRRMADCSGIWRR